MLAEGLAAAIAARAQERSASGSFAMSPRTLAKERLEEEAQLKLVAGKLTTPSSEIESLEDIDIPQRLSVSGVDSVPELNGVYDRVNNFQERPQWMMQGTRRYVRWIRGSWELYISHHPSGTTFFYANGALPPVCGWTPTGHVAPSDNPVFERGSGDSLAGKGKGKGKGKEKEKAANIPAYPNRTWPRTPLPSQARAIVTADFKAAISAKARAVADSNARANVANVSEAKRFVDDEITKNKVVIFSKEYCRHCIRAKAAFEKLGYNGRFALVELEKGSLEFKEDDPYSFREGTLDFEIEHVNPAGMPSLTYRHPQCSEIQDYLETLSGFRTVPQVFLGGKCIGGGEQVAEKWASGELFALLEGVEL